MNYDEIIKGTLISLWCVYIRWFGWMLWGFKIPDKIALNFVWEVFSEMCLSQKSKCIISTNYLPI